MTYNSNELESLKLYIQKIEDEINVRKEGIKESQKILNELHESIKELENVFKRTENVANYQSRMKEQTKLKKEINDKHQLLDEQKNDLSKAQELLIMSNEEMNNLIKEKEENGE